MTVIDVECVSMDTGTHKGHGGGGKERADLARFRRVWDDTVISQKLTKSRLNSLNNLVWDICACERSGHNVEPQDHEYPTPVKDEHGVACAVAREIGNVVVDSIVSRVEKDAPDVDNVTRILHSMYALNHILRFFAATRSQRTSRHMALKRISGKQRECDGDQIVFMEAFMKAIASRVGHIGWVLKHQVPESSHAKERLNKIIRIWKKDSEVFWKYRWTVDALETYMQMPSAHQGVVHESLSSSDSLRERMKSMEEASKKVFYMKPYHSLDD
jgi:hypothetical protein